MPSRIIACPQWRNFTSESPTIDVVAQPSTPLEIDMSHLLIQGANYDDNALEQFGFQGGWRLEYWVARNPEHGTVVKSCDKLGFIYTPNPNYIGGDCFNYQFSNGTQVSHWGKIRINVRAGIRVAVLVHRCTPVKDENHAFFDYEAILHEDPILEGQLEPRGISYWDWVTVEWQKLVPVLEHPDGIPIVTEQWQTFAKNRLVTVYTGKVVGRTNIITPIDPWNSVSFRGGPYKVGTFDETWPYTDVPQGYEPGGNTVYLQKQGPYPVKIILRGYKDQVNTGQGQISWINEWGETLELEASTEDNGKNDWWFNGYVAHNVSCDPEVDDTDPCDCYLTMGCAEDGDLPVPPCLGHQLIVIIYDNTQSTGVYDPLHRTRDIAHLVVNESLRAFNTQAYYLFVPRQTMAPFDPRILTPTRDICQVRNSINKTMFEGADQTFLEEIKAAVELGESYRAGYDGVLYFVVTDGADSQTAGTYPEFEQAIKDFNTVNLIRLNILICNTEQPIIRDNSIAYYSDLVNAADDQLGGVVHDAVADAPDYTVTQPLLTDRMVCGHDCEVQEYLDVDYGSHQDQFFDLYVPKCPDKAPYPLVILLHDGNWIGGDKQDAALQPFIKELPGDGQAVLTMNFRKAPEFPHPISLHDINCVLNWIGLNAATYNIDETRISLLGIGSGGHLALAYGVTPWAYNSGDCDYATPVSPSLTRVVGIAGPYSLNEPTVLANLRTEIDQYIGSDDFDIRNQASPVTHAPNYFGLAKFMIVHADGDPVVPLTVATELLGGLDSAGAQVTALLESKTSQYDWLLNDSDPEFAIEHRVKIYQFIR